MFKTLENLGSQVQEILNTNPKIQAVMTQLQFVADEKNFTEEQWQEMKERLFQSAIYFVLMNDEKIREELGNEIYEYHRQNA